MTAVTFFSSLDAALEYRKANGCGGWIFAADDGTATLFSFGMTPAQIFAHTATAGQSGELIS
jgi:hypothetical protein